MTAQNIDRFFSIVKGDEQLRAQLEASPSEESFFLTAVRAASERGLVFTVDEVRTASRAGQIGNELSESSLARVAGGEWQTVTSWRFCTWEWLGC